MSDRVAHIVDTCVFIACGRPENPKFRRLANAAKRSDGTFCIPSRVYEELGGEPETDEYGSGSLPVDSAIQSGWVSVMDPPDYTDSTVSRVMDDARRFISNKSDKLEDRVEKTDTALIGLAVQLLKEGRVEKVVIYTADQLAGAASERIIPRYGFDANQIEWVDRREFLSVE